MASCFYKACCDHCKHRDRRLQLHHKTYKRVGAEYLRDLCMVCGECHKRIHDLENTGGKDLWRSTKKASKTKKSSKDSNKHIKRCKKDNCTRCRKITTAIYRNDLFVDDYHARIKAVHLARKMYGPDAKVRGVLSKKVVEANERAKLDKS
jgi:hypothetical protein